MPPGNEYRGPGPIHSETEPNLRTRLSEFLTNACRSLSHLEITLLRSGAESGPWSDGGKLAAGVRASFIDSAKTGLRVHENAVPIGLLGQHKKLGTGAVRDDDLFFHQAFCKLLDRALSLVFGGQAQSDQIRQLDFDRHRATAAEAAIAHP